MFGLWQSLLLNNSGDFRLSHSCFTKKNPKTEKTDFQITTKLSKIRRRVEKPLQLIWELRVIPKAAHVEIWICAVCGKYEHWGLRL